MTFSKMLFVEFSADALLGHAKEATEEVDDCVDECLEAARLTLAVIDLDGLVGVGGVFTGSFNSLGSATSIAGFAITFHNPIMSERTSRSCLAGRAGLGSITISVNPDVSGLADELALTHDFITIKANNLSGVSVCIAGSADSALKGMLECSQGVSVDVLPV